MKNSLLNLSQKGIIQDLIFSGGLGCYIYFGVLINFLINSDLKTTLWIDDRKDKIKDNGILYTVRINKQVEIFEFSEFNILEAMKELCQTGKI